MVKARGVLAVGPAGLEGTAVLPDDGHAGFDIGGLVVFLDHGARLESRARAPSQPDQRQPAHSAGLRDLRSHHDIRARLYRGRTTIGGQPPGSAPARNPLDFGLDDALDHPRQVVVEPGLQHRPQHLLDQVLEGPGVAAQHGIAPAN